MGRFMSSSPMIATSVRLSPEFHKLCRENGINLTEALRIGISLMLADLGITDYDNNLNLFRKMRLFQEELEKKSQELEELKNKYEKNTKE